MKKFNTLFKINSLFSCVQQKYNFLFFTVKYTQRTFIKRDFGYLLFFFAIACKILPEQGPMRNGYYFDGLIKKCYREVEKEPDLNLRYLKKQLVDYASETLLSDEKTQVEKWIFFQDLKQDLENISGQSKKIDHIYDFDYENKK